MQWSDRLFWLGGYLAVRPTFVYRRIIPYMGLIGCTPYQLVSLFTGGTSFWNKELGRWTGSIWDRPKLYLDRVMNRYQSSRDVSFSISLSFELIKLPRSPSKMKDFRGTECVLTVNRSWWTLSSVNRTMNEWRNCNHFFYFASLLVSTAISVGSSYGSDTNACFHLFNRDPVVLVRAWNLLIIDILSVFDLSCYA